MGFRTAGRGVSGSSLGSSLGGTGRTETVPDSSGARPKPPKRKSIQNKKGGLDKPYSMEAALKKSTLLDDQGRLKSKLTEAIQYENAQSSLKDLAEQKLGGVKQDMRGIEALRGEATRTGPSAWGKLQEERSRAEEGFGVQDAASSSAGAIASARAGLASKRGLSSGAAERLGSAGARDAAQLQQKVRQAGMMGRMGIASEDERNRLGMLQGLPVADIATAQFELGKQKDIFGQSQREQAYDVEREMRNKGAQRDAAQYDANTVLSELGAQRGAAQMDIGTKLGNQAAGLQNKQFVYGQDMAGYGAAKSADAILQANKKPDTGILGKIDPTGGSNSIFSTIMGK